MLEPEELVNTALEFRKELEDFQFRYNSFLAVLAANLQRPEKDRVLTRPTLVDLGFLCRETSKLNEELRKQAKAHQNAISVIVCRKIVAHSLRFPSAKEKAKGTLASATPNIKPMPKIPKIDTPEWIILCDYFGVPVSARHVVEFSFKRVGAHLLNAAHQGKNVPFDITQPAGTEFDVIYRKLKQKTETDE